MKKHLRASAAFFVLIVVLVACASPISTNETQSSDQMATTVAMTFQALVPEIVGTPTNIPEVSTSLLSRSLYFLGTSDQVFRMERDGKTTTQLTFEPVNVDDYDVSLADGTIAYVANNQLLLANADGSNRRVLIDGGPRENNSWITNPVFSPDGKTLAYGRQGLNLYDLASGASQLVIPDQNSTETLPNGAPFPIETYAPESYSPDGSKLLLALGHWEVAPSHAVYHLATNTLVRYEEVEDYIYCCSFHGGPVWSPDSSSFYGVASVHDSLPFGELWRVDAENGGLTRIFKSPLTDESDGTIPLPVEPYLAPDGRLYFFFGTYHMDSGFLYAPVLEMVRSGPDGVTDQTILREENFVLMQEALWAPDASFVIVATRLERRSDQAGGVLELYPTDGQKDAIWLAPYGGKMKWGP